MVPVSARLARGRECVQKGMVLCDGALCDERSTISPIRPILVDAVPVLQEKV